MNDWKASLLEALESAQSVAFTFAASMDDYKRFDGAIEILGALIEGDDDIDEEALPYLRVRSSSGEVFLAEPDELRSNDLASLTRLIEAVARPFALAREVGYASPGDLMNYGTEQERSALLSGIQTQRRPSFWPSSILDLAKRCV
jgi:hypothetical protein